MIEIVAKKRNIKIRRNRLADTKRGALSEEEKFFARFLSQNVIERRKLAGKLFIVAFDAPRTKNVWKSLTEIWRGPGGQFGEFNRDAMIE